METSDDIETDERRKLNRRKNMSLRSMYMQRQKKKKKKNKKKRHFYCYLLVLWMNIHPSIPFENCEMTQRNDWLVDRPKTRLRRTAFNDSWRTIWMTITVVCAFLPLVLYAIYIYDDTCSHNNFCGFLDWSFHLGQIYLLWGLILSSNGRWSSHKKAMRRYRQSLLNTKKKKRNNIISLRAANHHI